MKQIRVGHIYEQKSGGNYVAIATNSADDEITFIRIGDGWTLIAHGARLDEDGLLFWDYSTGGYFAQ